MNATLVHIGIFAAVNLVIVLAGYPVLRSRRVMIGWLMLIASITLMHFVFLNEHFVLRMLAIIATTFSAMKVIAVTEGYRKQALTLGFKQWLVYAVGWVGMRAQPFEKLGGATVPGGAPMVRFGLSRIIAGTVLIALAHAVASSGWGANVVYVTVTVLLLVGFSLILHFGFLSISAGMWRFSGVNTYYLFRQPAKALSLTELWSKRWNIAFSEMTSVAIFRPLRHRIGPAGALLAAFLFSGLLHELALSLPVNAGYGLPTLYFLIQGLLVLTEKMMASRGVGFLNNTLMASMWVFFWLVIPMPLLFHQEFIRQILWPMAGLHMNS